jgi:hypothetical protein
MTGARTGRSRYSYLGIASFTLSFFPGVLLVGIDRLVSYLISLQPPGADEVGYASGMFVLAVLTVLSEIGHHKRMFAFLGVACSVLVLAVINSQVGLVDLAKFFAAFFTESQPKVHVVSHENE